MSRTHRLKCFEVQHRHSGRPESVHQHQHCNIVVCSNYDRGRKLFGRSGTDRDIDGSDGRRLPWDRQM